MSMTINRETAFFNRFRSLWARKQRVELAQVIVTTLLLALAGMGLLTVADYVLELDRNVRSFGLWTVLAGSLASGVYLFWRMFRRWNLPKTAADVEAAFPQLGQSVRTTIQFGSMKAEQVQSEGVATTLVSALAEQTHERALPLTLEDVVPSKRLFLIACGLATSVLMYLGTTGISWQWRNATQRTTLMADVPYRTLSVQPGNHTVDEGKGTLLRIDLNGRTNREVTLFTRPAGTPDGDWTERKLMWLDEHHQWRTANEQESPATVNFLGTSQPAATFLTSLDRLTKPIEYRVTAGELASSTYRIDIRRPMRIDEAHVELTPPAYTQQPMSTSLDPNLSVLEGTKAKFLFTFDKPVKSASLILAPRRQARDEDEPNEAVVLPMNLEATASQSLNDLLVAVVELTLTENRNYSIVAEAQDGTSLPETKYRIRVRDDQPPQVTFESPDDAIEVHTLAELPMRVRVRDDYGLSKAGVVFQINNEQEVPLIAQDFEAVANAANEVAATGVVSPTTQATLEKILPLEFFELTQKDSVMYFAFAEDNRPGAAQRTETEMRFIDIRPFKRTYRVIDPDPMPNNPNGSGGFKTLGELIQRQRYGLNRTMQIEKRAASGRKPDATTLDQLMSFETELAANVRETAEGLIARGFDDVELFFQAETSMLAAVDSLSVGKWDNATLQMKDALKFLIEARDNLTLAIFKNPNAARLAALRQFDRLQAQKLRRPKTDKEEARELIRRLEELIGQETDVVRGLDEGGETNPPETDEKKKKKSDGGAAPKLQDASNPD